MSIFRSLCFSVAATFLLNLSGCSEAGTEARDHAGSAGTNAHAGSTSSGGTGGGATGGSSANGGKNSGTGGSGGSANSGGSAGVNSGGSAGAPNPDPDPNRMRVIGYMPNWYGSYSSWASRVDFSKVTHINMAFALGDGEGNMELAPAGEIDAFVAAAHAKGVKVFPSLCGGGNDGRIAPFYEPHLVDSFVDKIINFAKARKFDGIDVDVEAPQRMGSKYDTFIAKLIAKARPLGLPVTAAVAQWMQHGMSDQTLRSFDFINVMSYDNTGTWTGAGEHSSYEQAETAMKFYTDKGVDKDKLVLGVPFYGYCWGNCDGKGSAYILYKDILKKFPNALDSDWIDSGGTKYSYNGRETLEKKTKLAKQYGGIMIWELAGDVSSSDTNSLLRAVDSAAR